MVKKVYNPQTMAMENVSGGKRGIEKIRVAIPATLAEELKKIAIADKYDFSGVSYITEKDKDGNTKHDKDGNPVFKMENGKKVIKKVAESTGKVNSAISDYAVVAIREWLENRKSITPTPKQ